MRARPFANLDRSRTVRTVREFVYSLDTFESTNHNIYTVLEHQRLGAARRAVPIARTAYNYSFSGKFLYANLSN
jgi:hypothetical protein